MCLVVEYLCKLHQQDPSFLFDIQCSEENAFVGICWKTASLRFDWDSSASCISLDGMKRQLDKFSYPYLAVTSLDWYGHMVVCAEAICISERIEAYSWLLRCFQNFSCTRKLENIKAVYGDGLVTSASLLVSLGIQDSCALLDDVHHLLSADCDSWYKHFGSEKWGTYGELLKVLVYKSFKLEEYTQIRSAILSLMNSRNEPPQLYDYFDNVIHAGRKQFVRYSVNAIFCNEHLLGSSVEESNNASYVARISAGSLDDPAIQIKDCLRRMTELAAKYRSKIVFGE